MSKAPSTFLTVQEGCDKFCTFCVVPYTRGAEFSRPVSDVCAEARRMVAAGAREITVLGQNVNAYHGALENGRDCGRLGQVNPRIGRDRWAGAHPLYDLASARHGRRADRRPWRDRRPDALYPSAGSVRLRPHPGSDEPRAYHMTTIGGSLIDCVRRTARHRDLLGFHRRVPRARASRDFEDTLTLVRSVGYAQAYSFKYSARPGTPASTLVISGTRAREGRSARHAPRIAFR